uniref:NADH:ubiquinone oxidoreductase core subunit S8b n=1 Tax=Hucho hucho TaxID=62062 RepID=A0A4W5KPA5_9TELE
MWDQNPIFCLFDSLTFQQMLHLSLSLSLQFLLSVMSTALCLLYCSRPGAYGVNSPALVRHFSLSIQRGMYKYVNAKELPLDMRSITDRAAQTLLWTELFRGDTYTHTHTHTHTIGLNNIIFCILFYNLTTTKNNHA